ncbi:MAG: hypothetical protein HQM00_14585 [Magnetococcales bacterium]|nr:hypothetical protein [Magnetococcales bacterium]
MRIGIDFDNTLTDMDPLLATLVRAQGWFAHPETLPEGKTALRQTIRALDDGEVKWQRLQATLYGPELYRAPLRTGAEHFFHTARQHRIPLFIVSHKTRYARQDEAQRHDLRALATDWLARQGFFDPHGFNLPEDHLFFTDTRAEKARRIDQLNCTHFIDDLPELFAEPDFPATTTPLLLDPTGTHRADSPGATFPDWYALTRSLFPDAP